MPKFRVKELSLIGNELVQPGTVVDYDADKYGYPAGNLEPLDEEGQALCDQYEATNTARIKALAAANSTSAVGDPSEFAAAVAAAIQALVASGQLQLAPARKAKAAAADAGADGTQGETLA